MLISLQLFHALHMSCRNLVAEHIGRRKMVSSHQPASFLWCWPRLFQPALDVRQRRTCHLFTIRFCTDTKGASAALTILQRHTRSEMPSHSRWCSGLCRHGMTDVSPLFSMKVKASHEPPRWSTNKSHQMVSCHKTSPERMWNARITVQTNHRDREYCCDK